MNKIIISIIIVLFIIGVGIGFVALSEDTTPTTKASKKTCPVQEFPEDKECPEGTSLDLIENDEGCLEFSCV